MVSKIFKGKKPAIFLGEINDDLTYFSPIKGVDPISSNAFIGVCYFVNSGSEANELALRLAYNYTNSREVIVLDHAYHGNTSSLIDISPYKYQGKGGKGPGPHTHKAIMPDLFQL